MFPSLDEKKLIVNGKETVCEQSIVSTPKYRTWNKFLGKNLTAVEMLIYQVLIYVHQMFNSLNGNNN
jgi:hypothetical protein